MNDTLTNVQPQITNATEPNNGTCWLYVILIIIAISGILVTLYLKLIRPQWKERQKTKQQLLQQSTVDFDNVINSSFAAKELYDKLKVKCHPDRFTDADLNKEATRLFQEIHKNKYNYKALTELKEEATDKLNINI